MAYTVQFLLTLMATVLCTVGLLQTHSADVAGERLVGVLVLIALPLVLGSWFRRLRREEPPVWWELRQQLPGATGEPLPILEPAKENPFFPLPWFLLPLIPISVILGVVTGHTVLFLAPVAATIGWVGLVGLVVLASAVSHRPTRSSGLQRMLADFRQGPSDGGASYPETWAGIVFDRHRPSMDYATLETLFRTGLEDAYGDSHRWPSEDVARLPPLFARDGWRCALEDEGLMPRDASRHQVRTDLPEAVRGWQCPRCHTVNRPAARRCSLIGLWDPSARCRERRPGLSRAAELGHTILEFAELVVYMVLFFGPLLLAILAVYGVLTLHWSGDPAALLAATALTAVWRVSIRLPVDIAREARESLEMFVAVFGWLPLVPFMWLADPLRRVLRIGVWVEIIAEESALVVRPSIIEAGKVRFRASNVGHDEELLISIVRTPLPPNSLPADLEEYLAGRPTGATLIGEAVVDAGESERTDLSLAPGRYVIGCQPWAGVNPDEVGRYSAMRATLRAVR